MKNSETILATIFLVGMLALVGFFMWQFLISMADLFQQFNYTPEPF